jgi:transposase
MTTKVTTLHRSPSPASAEPAVTAEPSRPDPEVPARAKRRTFTARYKQQILAEYDAAPDGE